MRPRRIHLDLNKLSNVGLMALENILAAEVSRAVGKTAKLEFILHHASVSQVVVERGL